MGWRYPPILLKPAQVLSDILFLSFSAFQRAQQVVGVEQGVGDFRALLQAAADGGNRLAGLAAEPRLPSKRMRMPRMLRTSPKAGAIRRRGCPVVPPCAAAGVPVFRLPGFQASGQALLFLAGQEEDATVTGCACARVRRRRRRAGRAEAGKRSWHHHSQDRRPAPLRSVALASASALQRHLALLLQAAEDGVGDLHPLGIGIVAVGRIRRPRSRPGTNAT